MSHHLLPCPFCGGTPELAKTAYGRPVMKWVRCLKCEASATAYGTAESAYAAWNQRASPAQAQLFEPVGAAVPGVVAELVEACRANEQCIADFLEAYKHGAPMLILDEAVQSLRDDGLKVTRRALAQAATL